MIKKILSVILAVGLFAGYLIFLKEYTSEDQNQAPQIEFDENHLELSTADGEERLLEGVHAYDSEDGDLTENIIVDSISAFDENDNRTVTYVVFDRDNKPAQAERTISYTDYTPPRLRITDSLILDTVSTSKLNNMFQAESCVDGDISNNINVKIGTLQDNQIRLDVSVNDSTGTETSVTAFCDYDRNVYLADIVLQDYLMYIPAGTAVDFRSNISDILIGKQSSMNLLGDVIIQSSVDFQTPGTYEVYYYLSGGNGSSGRTKGIVVVQ